MLTTTLIEVDPTRTNNKNVCFSIKSLTTGQTSRQNISRSAMKSLRDMLAVYFDSRSCIANMRDFSRWAVNGCPCNLAEELGFSNAKYMYTVMNFWDRSLFYRNGNLRILAVKNFGREAMKGTSNKAA